LDISFPEKGKNGKPCLLLSGSVKGFIRTSQADCRYIRCWCDIGMCFKANVMSHYKIITICIIRSINACKHVGKIACDWIMSADAFCERCIALLIIIFIFIKILFCHNTKQYNTLRMQMFFNTLKYEIKNIDTN
jgi:hypothetical protein